MTLTRRDKRALANTLRLLEKYGWVQGHMGSTRGGYCLVGAVYASTPWSARRKRIYAALIDCLPGLRYSTSHPSILTNWNDQWARTKTEVIEVIKCGLGEKGES